MKIRVDKKIPRIELIQCVRQTALMVVGVQFHGAPLPLAGRGLQSCPGTVQMMTSRWIMTISELQS